MSAVAPEAPGPPVPGDDTNPPVDEDPPKSFRDSLMTGMQIDDQGTEEVYRTNTQDADEKSNKPLWEPSEIVDSVNGVWPSVQVAGRVVERLAEPWKRSVVVKLFQRSIGYNALMTRLLRLWNPAGKLQIVDLENNFYLVRFSNDADWVHALFYGPWLMLGTYLVVQQWSPEFDVEKGITWVTAWVRFPKLPVLWYNKQFMAHLGNLIGRTIKIDMNTQQGNRGKFARVAVSLDMNKPLLDRFELNGKWYRIEYEGIQSICFTCGCMGHTKEACSVTPEANNMASTGDSIPRSTENAENGGINTPITELPGMSGDNIQSSAPEFEARFGPWMQVRRQRRPFRKAAGYGDVNNQNWKQVDTNPIFGTDEGEGVIKSGSRYDVLASEFEGQQDCSEDNSKAQPMETSRPDKLKERNKGIETGSQLGKNTVKGSSSAGPGMVDGGLKFTRQMAMNSVESDKGVGGSGPITVGPLSHNFEFSVTAAKGVNGKMRKLQACKETKGSFKADRDEIVSVGGAGLSGSKTMSDIMKETSFWKPVKNPKPVKLGKRKPIPNYQKEHPPDVTDGGNLESSASVAGAKAITPLIPEPVHDTGTVDLVLEDAKQSIAMTDQEDPPRIAA